MYLQVSGGSVYYSQYDGTGKAINVIAMEIRWTRSISAEEIARRMWMKMVSATRGME